MEGQNYHPQDRSSIAASRGNKTELLSVKAVELEEIIQLSNGATFW